MTGLVNGRLGRDTRGVHQGEEKQGTAGKPGVTKLRQSGTQPPPRSVRLDKGVEFNFDGFPKPTPTPTPQARGALYPSLGQAQILPSHPLRTIDQSCHTSLAFSATIW